MAEEIFTASTENLRDLKKQRKRICALVNRAIREKQDIYVGCALPVSGS